MPKTSRSSADLGHCRASPLGGGRPPLAGNVGGLTWASVPGAASSVTHVSVPAAISYATRLRTETQDPVVKKNADQSISVLVSGSHIRSGFQLVEGNAEIESPPA